MKANIFLTLLSIALAALLGYLAFYMAGDNENNAICGIASTICFISTLVPAMGLQYEYGRLGANIRVVSVLFLVIFLISHFCFARFGVKMPFYIIINGFLLIIYLAVFYKMQGIKDI